MNKLVAFIEHRLGWVSGCSQMASRPVVGGARLRHVFPPLMLYLFLQQAVLGIALATYYSPSATDAWASTAYIQDQVTLGWFVRGLHYHGTSVMVVLGAVWLTTLALTRAYRRPWELTWVAVVALAGLTLAFGLTGNPLPWDQAGYWGIQVELGIAEETPGGTMIRTLIQGGSEAGNLTVLRLYAIHVFVLPLAFLALLFVVFKQRRLHGDAGPPAHPQGSVAYYPSQMFLDVVAIAVVVSFIVGMTVHTHGAELLGPADPTENFQARPEWYFLFLYKLRMAFEGPLEPVATMVLPGAVAGFLLVLPLLDPTGRPPRIWIARIGVCSIMLIVLALTAVAIVSDARNEEFQKSLAAAEKSAERARKYALEGVLPLGGTAVFFNDPEYKTKQLYKEHCQNCHMLDGFGGEEAPDLTDYSSRAWLAAVVRNPDDPRFFGATKHKGEMEAYPESELSAEQLSAVVEYLVSLMEDPEMPADAELAKKGKKLWDDDLDCNSCHEVAAGEEGDGPNLWHHGREDWVVRVIKDSSKGDLFGKKAEMPKFEGKLSEEEIQALAALVVRQRRPPAE